MGFASRWASRSPDESILRPASTHQPAAECIFHQLQRANDTHHPPAPPSLSVDYRARRRVNYPLGHLINISQSNHISPVHFQSNTNFLSSVGRRYVTAILLETWQQRNTCDALFLWLSVGRVNIWHPIHIQWTSGEQLVKFKTLKCKKSNGCVR